MLIATAKSSPDPLQNKLRENKKIWNKEVSNFIDDIINFKKLINGQPSKFFKEKSTIKDPIPSNPDTTIGSLANKFQEITQKGNAIIQQQIDYSKIRRKKNPKKMESIPSFIGSSSTIPSSPSDLSQQLSASIEAYELVAQASNPFSRFFSKLLNPPFGNQNKVRVKKYRISLLNSAVEISKDLSKLQIFIIKSTPESIFAASKILSKIINNWNFFKTGIDTYKKSSLDSASNEGIVSIQNKSDSPPININDYNKSILDKILTILEDYRKNAANFLDTDFKKLTSLLISFKEEKELNNKLKIAKLVELEYLQLLNLLNSKFGTSGSSLKEIWKVKKSKANIYYDNELESIGQDFFKKWLGTTKHKLNPFDKTSAHRLDIYNFTENAIKVLNSIMNSLEKEMNTELIEKLSIKITENLRNIEFLMLGLSSTIDGKYFDKSFMNLLDNGDITNFSPELSTSQRDHLKKMIDQKRLRDLTNIYQGNKK